LIRDEERTVLAGVPGLSDVPLVGHLFASNHKETTETDIILTLTPHIVRVLDLSEADLRPFRLSRDSGTGGGDQPPAQVPRDEAPPRDPLAPPQPVPGPTFPQPLQPPLPGTQVPPVPPKKPGGGTGGGGSPVNR